MIILRYMQIRVISFNDSDLIEPTKDYFDGFMQRYLLGLEDSGAYLNNVWTGCK